MKQYVQTSEEQQREAKLLLIEVDKHVALAELSLMEGNPKEALAFLRKAEKRMNAAKVFCEVAIDPFAAIDNVVRLEQARSLPD